jgi:vanillin dehydrogenase
MTRAIDAAYAVKDVWGNTLPSERELILIRAADVLESMRGEVVDLLIEEGGAAFGKSQFEVSYVKDADDAIQLANNSRYGSRRQ